MFPDKPLVDARAACPTVYEGTGVNGFYRVQGDDELNWNLHGG